MKFVSANHSCTFSYSIHPELYRLCTKSELLPTYVMHPPVTCRVVGLYLSVKKPNGSESGRSWFSGDPSAVDMDAAQSIVQEN